MVWVIRDSGVVLRARSIRTEPTDPWVMTLVATHPRIAELLDDPDREGWRGNPADWVRRARAALAEPDVRDDPAALRALAPVVTSWRLLGCAPLACAVPRRPAPGAFDPVWQDARHVVVRRCDAATPAQRDVWIGCLAYYLRHRPRLPPAAARSLRPPPGALARALEPAFWAPDGVCAAQGVCRTRTVAVLTAVDTSAGDALREGAALPWLEARPRDHLTSALRTLLGSTH